jgi:hypothetical protein
MVVEIADTVAAIVETVLMLVLGLFPRRRLGAQFSGALAVPAVDFRVCLRGEGFLGQFRWESLAVVGVLKVPVAHGVLHEGDMFLRRQQDFNCLPTHEALDGQGRNAGLEVVVFARLQGVLAACDLPYVRDRLVGDLVEECVVVTADGFVEGGEFRWCEVLLVLVANLVNLGVTRLLVKWRGEIRHLEKRTMCRAIAFKRASRTGDARFFASSPSIR